jgi:transposase-like protein
MINVDGNLSYPKVISELKWTDNSVSAAGADQSATSNNIIEQDHRAIKVRVRASQGFRALHSACGTIEGVETMNMIRKGQIRWLSKNDISGQPRSSKEPSD